VIVRNAPKPNINWSSIARRALRNKYLDGELPEGKSVTDVARDVLAAAAEIDPGLKDINFEKDAIEALRKEITRQLAFRRMEKSRKRHLPTGAEIASVSVGA
jgi:hypothetical protein